MTEIINRDNCALLSFYGSKGDIERIETIQDLKPIDIDRSVSLFDIRTYQYFKEKKLLEDIHFGWLSPNSELVKYLYSEGKLTDDQIKQIFNGMNSDEGLETLTFLNEQGKISDEAMNQFFSYSAPNAIALAKYLYETGKITDQSFINRLGMCESSVSCELDFGITTWLFSVFRYSDFHIQKFFKKACFTFRLEHVKIICSNYEIPSEMLNDQFSRACNAGEYSFAKFLYETGKIDQNVIDSLKTSSPLSKKVLSDLGLSYKFEFSEDQIQQILKLPSRCLNLTILKLKTIDPNNEDEILELLRISAFAEKYDMILYLDSIHALSADMMFSFLCYFKNFKYFFNEHMGHYSDVAKRHFEICCQSNNLEGILSWYLYYNAITDEDITRQYHLAVESGNNRTAKILKKSGRVLA